MPHPGERASIVLDIEIIAHYASASVRGDVKDLIVRNFPADRRFYIRQFTDDILTEIHARNYQSYASNSSEYESAVKKLERILEDCLEPLYIERDADVLALARKLRAEYDLHPFKADHPSARDTLLLAVSAVRGLTVVTTRRKFAELAKTRKIKYHLLDG